MGGFLNIDAIDGDDDVFLSANGKTRKEKKALKKSEKEKKLRAKKGAEIAASANELMGIPSMPVTPEKKKGLKGIVANIKDNRDKRQSDKLYKQDFEKAKKEGTLSKAEFPAEKKKKDLSGIKNTVLGLPALLGLDSGDEKSCPDGSTPVNGMCASKSNKFNTGKTVQYAILGLGVLALAAIVISKGIPNKTQAK